MRVLSVEYVHGQSSKQQYVEYMKQQGYEVHKDIRAHDMSKTQIVIVDDFIFVKKTP